MEKWTTCQEIAGTIYTASENGWITRAIYTQWFIEFFVPHVNSRRGTRADGTLEPVLYIFDGHDLEEADQARKDARLESPK